MLQFRQDQVTVRVDRQMTDRHKLFVRFSRHSNREERPSTFPALGATELWGPAFNLAGSLTSNFGTSLVHELRVSRMYGEYRSTAYFQGEGADLLAQAGVRGLELAQDPAISSLPAFSFSGYAGFSGNAGDGRPKWQNRGEWEITDNLTWLKGRHILKFGGRVYRRKILFTDARDHNGTYGFTGVMTQNPASATGTGDGFADFLLGYPANSTRSNPATWWGGYGTYWHGFFQDDVKVTNRLTLNLGIRYQVHAVADRIPRPGGGLRSEPRQADHRVEQYGHDRSQLAASRRRRLRAVLRPDPDQQPGRRAAEPDEERQSADRAAAGVCLAPVRREHGAARRLRHLLRSGGDRRPAQFQLHSVPHQRNGDRRGQRCADHARSRISGRACRSARLWAR